MRAGKLMAAAAAFFSCALLFLSETTRGPVARVVYAAQNNDDNLDSSLAAVLSAAGFTGNIEQAFRQRLEANLGRPINPKLADLGRMLWFDKIHSLHHDNTCGGWPSPPHQLCHSHHTAT